MYQAEQLPKRTLVFLQNTNLTEQVQALSGEVHLLIKEIHEWVVAG